MDRLLNGKVSPAKTDEQPLDSTQIDSLIKELGNNWQCIDYHHLEKEFLFENFAEALSFVNRIGEYSEEVNHHPLITFTWGKATISIYTHDVDGLREADFFWAAKIESLYK